MLATCDPIADALRHEDAQEYAAYLDEQEAIELADRFVKAAEHGADEPLQGIEFKTKVSEALYSVSSDKPELLDAIFYWAARQTDNPVLRAMVMEVGAHWAKMEQGARHD